MSELADRVRRRLKDEMHRKHLSQKDVADLIGQDWTQVKVGQKIQGKTEITLPELEALCFAVGIYPSEAVRDPGLEFLAEMTPRELRLLERFRQLTPTQFEALGQILAIRGTSQPERFASRPKRPIGSDKG